MLSSITYRPEIDGLRAIAVIPVILFHINAAWLPGGYIGVDVFFVISGYLITSIILDEYIRGVFSFRNFWLRRVRRILPVLIAMVLTTLLAGMIILYGPDMNNLGNQGVASLLSFANISHWLLVGNYWGYSAESSPFLHTWSLSVEEQFYLFFPVFLMIALKYFHNWLALTVLIISLISMFLFFYGTQNHPSATFYLLPTRVWELGVGSLLAINNYKNIFNFNNNLILSIISFLVIMASYFFISGDGDMSPFLIAPVIASAFVIAFSKESGGIINKILSAFPVVYIGKISYSLYLWHWPVLVLSRQLSLMLNAEVNYFYVISVIFILSVLSYHFIEIPTRRNKKIVPYIFFALIGSVVFSYTIKFFDFTEDVSFYNVTEWHGDSYNVSPKHARSKLAKVDRMKGVMVSSWDSVDINAYANGGVRKIYGQDVPEIVVLGDSHALMWAKVLDEVAKELGTSISFYAANATPTFFDIPIKKTKSTRYFSLDEKYVFDSARLFFLKKWRPKVVVISAKWDSIKSIQETNDLIEFIGSIGSKVLLIEQPPRLFFGDKNALQYFSYLDLTDLEISKQYVQHADFLSYKKGLDLVELIANTCGFCQRVITSDLFLTNNKVLVIDSYNVLYIDDDHLSYKGALKAKDRIIRSLQVDF